MAWEWRPLNYNLALLRLFRGFADPNRVVAIVDEDVADRDGA
jgi:hypothetical protein